MSRSSRDYLLIVPTALVLVALFAGPAFAEDEGQGAFVAQKCNMCHSVPQAELVAKVKSEKMKGPDLPAVARDSEWLTQFLKREIQNEGQEHKKEYTGTDEELQAIAAWLAKLDVPAQ
ncbi:MAG: hypothetical protein GTN89_00230 [Acidobacteria bacterium]|nr:hypothetical protein [Acidobacteriota bacterium]NIM60149.1 hypothetical protein [Acidobacteriota bacterium]NIO57818.1 hypothetical protein [Acidobacteriota bacterium]NIQ28827.1 hypothetical protein [Acidobacteriota bacterium]NIQ83285.1 hypothetical protein [Acidobacteriota bacterium]